MIKGRVQVEATEVRQVLLLLQATGSTRQGLPKTGHSTEAQQQTGRQAAIISLAANQAAQAEEGLSLVAALLHQEEVGLLREVEMAAQEVAAISVEEDNRWICLICTFCRGGSLK